MKVGMVVNDVATEEAGYTTTRLGMTALNMGHDAWLMGVGDLATDPDDTVRAWARAAPRKSYRSTKTYLAEVQGDKARVERIGVDDLDVLLLRNDPAADLGRPWAQSAGFIFGERAAHRGVIVLNDPATLATAINKMYLQRFPEKVRPRALISRSADDLRAFVEGEGGRAVLKPLQGSGGTNVFVVKPIRDGQPQPDHRGGLARRLRDRPGVPARGQEGRHPAVSHERRAARRRWQGRRVPPSHPER